MLHHANQFLFTPSAAVQQHCFRITGSLENERNNKNKVWIYGTEYCFVRVRWVSVKMFNVAHRLVPALTGCQNIKTCQSMEIIPCGLAKGTRNPAVVNVLHYNLHTLNITAVPWAFHHGAGRLKTSLTLCSNKDLCQLMAGSVNTASECLLNQSISIKGQSLRSGNIRKFKIYIYNNNFSFLNI